LQALDSIQTLSMQGLWGFCYPSVGTLSIFETGKSTKRVPDPPPPILLCSINSLQLSRPWRTGLLASSGRQHVLAMMAQKDARMASDAQTASIFHTSWLL